VTWEIFGTLPRKRVLLSRSLRLILGGVFLFSALSILVLGGTALRLHRENGALDARAASIAAERAALAERLERVQSEVAEAREVLGRMREEQNRIRAWLDSGDPTSIPAVAEDRSGKGSLGEVELDAVAPEDRAAEAEGAEDPTAERVDQAARSLAAQVSELAAKVQAKKQQMGSIPSISPVDGEHWITSGFGWRRSPFSAKREFHNGNDLAAARGTAIMATADGVVSDVVEDGALGHVVTIDHGNGIQTTYGHMEEASVEKGQRVTRGQSIGTMGSSGKRSTGPHVHYAVVVDGKYVNPARFIGQRLRYLAEARRR